MCEDNALYVGFAYARHRHLSRHLEHLGIELHKALTILAAKELLQKQLYSLVLIYFETFCKQIFEFCSYIRSENPDTVIIVLMTNPKNRTEKRLFDFGVDDVVVGDPICDSTLSSRIKRRIFSVKPLWSNQKKIMLKGGTLVNFARKEVRRNGSARPINRSVDKLLRYFLDNPNRVISRDEMWESDLWDKSVCRAIKEEGGKAFDMAIGRLRRAIEINPKNPQIIKTVHGRGWMLAKDTVL